MTENRIRVQEYSFASLKGEFPKVETYPHVDVTLLTEGDTDPLYLTLPIAEIGRVSENGLLYDSELVQAITEQMQQGKGGIRGHLKEDELNTAFPTDDVYWVGHQLVGEMLWAKGYIPPGKNRDDIRRKKATGGRVATSIFGDAVRETADQVKGKKTWRARQFRLEQIDLAPAGRAALRMSGHMQLTQEMTEGNMPDEIKITDVPETIREQIIQEAGLRSRVSELETQVKGVAKVLNVSIEEVPAKVAELVQYQRIVAEISANIDPKQDVVQVFTAYQNSITKLAEMLGVPYTNITLRVEQMHEQIAEMKKKEFDGAVDTKVSEMTPWQTKDPKAQEKLNAFRRNFKNTILTGLKGATETTKVAEVAQSVWDADFKPLAEMLVRELGGPPAIVGGSTPDGASAKFSDEQILEWGARHTRAASNGGSK